MTILEALPHGGRYAELIRMIKQAWHNYYYEDSAFAEVMSQPDIDTLEHFGYVLQAEPVRNRYGWDAGRNEARQVYGLVGGSRNEYVLTWMQRSVESLPTFERVRDGSIVEFINLADLQQIWDERYRQFGYDIKQQVMQDDGPYWIAAAMAMASDGTTEGWEEDPDNPERIIRRLPGWTYAMPNAPVSIELPGRNTLDVVAWAVLPGQTYDNQDLQDALVYLSAVGGALRLRAGWAVFQDSKRTSVQLHNDTHAHDMGGRYRQARRPEGRGIYHTFFNDRPLPVSKRAHMIMSHYSLTKPRMGEGFLHVVGYHGLPDLARFRAQYQAAVPYPWLPDKAQELWDAGVKHECIIRIPARGCVAYWVRGDYAAWPKAMAEAMGKDPNNIQTERFGTLNIDRVVPLDEDNQDKEDNESDD